MDLAARFAPARAVSEGSSNSLSDRVELERAKGFEPSTPTLARSCSTPELHPHRRELAGRKRAAGQTYAKCGLPMQPEWVLLCVRQFQRNAAKPMLINGFMTTCDN